MAVETPGAFNQTQSYGAEQFRRALYDLTFARGATIGSVLGGVGGYGDFAPVATGSGLTINIAAGEAIIPGSSTTTQGGYYARGSSTTAITMATANATNPRIDLICLTITDSSYSGSTNTFAIQAVTGTPTSGATLSNLTGAPALPTSSLLICYVDVTAAASTLSSANILDSRPYLTLAQNIFNKRLLTSTATAASGDNIGVTSGTFTITLPAPFPNARVKVTNYGSGVVTVSHSSSEVIYGLGCGSSGQTTILLGTYGATATMECLDGSNWFITSGMQDTGWIALSSIGGGLQNSWANGGGPATGATVPGYRKIGNVIRLGGTVSGGSTNTVVTTLPAGFHPTSAQALPAGTTAGSNSFAYWGISTAGVIIPEFVTGTVPSFDGVTFTVD
jgi:hypothetical protein